MNRYWIALPLALTLAAGAGCMAHDKMSDEGMMKDQGMEKPMSDSGMMDDGMKDKGMMDDGSMKDEGGM
jgi:hypothetical protein